MLAIDVAKDMLTKVATALDKALLEKVAFVGGCTTGLLVTDDYSRQAVRFTDDVDVIVSVVGKAGWYQLRDQLIDSGFTESMDDALLENPGFEYAIQSTARNDEQRERLLMQRILEVAGV